MNQLEELKAKMKQARDEYVMIAVSFKDVSHSVNLDDSILDDALYDYHLCREAYVNMRDENQTT